MPAIQRRYHFGLVTLTPNLTGPYALCGQTVNVRIRDGQLIPIYFAGFVNYVDVNDKGWRKVKIDDVPFYSRGNSFFDEWIYYGQQTTMLGAMPLGMKEVWLVLLDELPIAWCELNSAPSVRRYVSPVSNN